MLRSPTEDNPESRPTLAGSNRGSPAHAAAPSEKKCRQPPKDLRTEETPAALLESGDGPHAALDIHAPCHVLSAPPALAADAAKHIRAGSFEPDRPGWSGHWGTAPLRCSPRPQAGACPDKPPTPRGRVLRPDGPPRYRIRMPRASMGSMVSGRVLYRSIGLIGRPVCNILSSASNYAAQG